ncbi:MAG: hypothetical protein QM784_30645 [Polyangiaceae bacterium]
MSNLAHSSRVALAAKKIAWVCALLLLALGRHPQAAGSLRSDKVAQVATVARTVSSSVLRGDRSGSRSAAIERQDAPGRSFLGLGDDPGATGVLPYGFIELPQARFRLLASTQGSNIVAWWISLPVSVARARAPPQIQS